MVANPPAARSSQWDITCRESFNPCRPHSCSYRYSGKYITNFCTIRWAMASGEAKLPGSIAGSLGVFTIIDYFIYCKIDCSQHIVLYLSKKLNDNS